MLEILLMGVVVVANYLVAHQLVVVVERRRGQPLGGARSVIFFLTFLMLTMLAFWLAPMALAAAEAST